MRIILRSDVEALLPEIQKWFAEKQEHLSIFESSDCLLEGRFKGELLVWSTQLQQSGVITKFEREAKVPSGFPQSGLPSPDRQRDASLRTESALHSG